MAARLQALLVAASVAVTFVASAPREEEPYEVFNSMPGPFFTLSDGQNVVDWLVTIRTTPAAFPPEGSWTELFEIELDLAEQDFGETSRVVSGRLARVALETNRVLSSTVGRIPLPEERTLILTDERGETQCDAEVCEKRYFVRFVVSGFGVLRTQWFIRAGIDWAQSDLEVPESAHLTLLPQRL